MLVEPLEQPLCPPVVLGVRRAEFTVPVVAEPQFLHRVAHLVDTLLRPELGIDIVGDGFVLRGQPEGIPPHRLQHLLAL